MSQYFIASTNTNIGKTFLLTEICKKKLAQNFKVDAIKPVASGFDDNFLSDSDSTKILQSLKMAVNKKNLDKITPWRFKAPLSPSIAARRENIELDFSDIIEFCKKRIMLARKNDTTLLIEGAGGVMTPITQDKTFLDLNKELKLPVFLLSANYLGAINHTLCAVEALRTQSIEIKKIIVNNYYEQNYCDNSVLDLNETIGEIRRFSKIDTISMPQMLQEIDFI